MGDSTNQEKKSHGILDSSHCAKIEEYCLRLIFGSSFDSSGGFSRH